MSAHESAEEATTRRRAEAERRVHQSLGRAPLPAEETERLLHELQVHQIELELQNEELRQAQLELEVSRARYFDLYDLAPVGYLSLDEQGVIVEANLTASTLLGVVRSGLAHHALTRYVARADQDVFFRHRRMLEHSGAAQVCELRIVRKDGHTMWARLESTAAPHHGRGTRVAISDISPQKAAEAAVAASELRHRTLFETAHDALLVLAMPGCTITAANARAAALLGSRELIAQPLWQLAPPTQPSGRASQEELQTRADVALGHGSHAFDWMVRRPGAEDLTVAVALTRMELDGQVRLHAALRELTELRKLQAQVAQTDRLASMGMLAAGVGHEINNPLTYMLYNLETAVEELERLGDRALAPSEHASLLAKARDALGGTMRIRAITRALAAFSRTEVAPDSAVSVNYALECAITMATSELRHRASLVRELGEVPAVAGTDGQLSQVFLNLLIHAARAITEGDVEHNTITLRSWREGDNVFAEVRDTGHGIPASHLSRVFDPFFAPSLAGAGMGLAISARIIRELGGEITVESQVGVGSRFVVRLPVTPLTPSVPPAPPVLSATAARGRILVLDDERMILQVTQRILGAEHEVTTVESGAEALAILAKDRAFDVILCDLAMPQMMGTDFHQRLSQLDPELAERVVFMSGGVFTPRATAYLAERPLLVLAKPVDVQELKRVVAERVALQRPA